MNVAAAQGLNQVKTQAETFGRSLFAVQVNDAGLSNTQFVTNLYEAFLQRGPDAGGLSFWSGQATVGTGRQNVLSQFATCPPFYELAGTLYREAFWLVADHLGTPRMIVNKSGSLAGVKRHDYLPFGEEIGGPQVALLGGRTTTQGYTGDSVRQHFTGYEADGETGLNFAQARYQSPIQGRFTSVDPFGASAGVTNPQSFNRYSYVENDPINHNDPTGMALSDIGVYQTGNPEVANKLENEMVRLIRQMSSPQIPYNGDGILSLGELPQDEPLATPLTSVTVLGNNVNITYGRKLSLANRLSASNSIAAAAGLINDHAEELTDDEKKAIGKIKWFSVVGPGSPVGATGTGLILGFNSIQMSSPAYLASLFGHEGQHNLNVGKYSGSDLWRDEQSAGRTQLTIGIKLGFSSAERRGLEQWIADSNRDNLQRHMKRGVVSR